MNHLKESTPKSKVSKERSRSKGLLIQGHMAALNWSLQKAWHASLGYTWHTPHTTRVPRSRKRKPQTLTPSPALPLMAQIYLRISQISFLTHQIPKDALKMLKTEQNLLLWKPCEQGYKRSPRNIQQQYSTYTFITYHNMSMNKI